MLKCYPRTLEICHVVVGDIEKHPDIPERTTDHRVVAVNSIDIIVECFGGVGLPYPLIAAALGQGKFVSDC